MSTPSRDSAADQYLPEGDKARQALAMMSGALDLIDENDGPHDVGAYLDQAICRLTDWIERKPTK